MTKLKTINEIRKEIEELTKDYQEVPYGKEEIIDKIRIKQAQLQTTQNIYDEIDKLKYGDLTNVAGYKEKLKSKINGEKEK